MSKCTLNTCSERISAQCVLFTCDVTSKYITLAGCDPTLCEYLAVTERLITELKDAGGILAAALAGHNCGFTRIDTLINTHDAIYHKVKTSDTIITLLDIICDLKAQIDDIWNLPLHADILNDPLLESCLGAGVPCGPLIPKTLKDLLIALMHKTCECCP
jgi:hypothetical protein